MGDWAGILKQYSRGESLRYAVHSLTGDFSLSGTLAVPEAVVATAARMPRFPFTLCPELPMFCRVPAMRAELPDASLRFQVDTEGMARAFPQP